MMSARAGACPCRSTNRKRSLSSSIEQYFYIAFYFLRIDLRRAAKGTVIPKQKAVVVIHDAARRQSAETAFRINSLRRIGYAVIVQTFQYFRPGRAPLSHQSDHVGKGNAGEHGNAAVTAKSGLDGNFLNTVYFPYGAFLGIRAVVIDPRQRFDRLYSDFIFFFSLKRRQRFLRYGNEITPIPLGNQFTFKRELRNCHSAWNTPLQARLFPHVKRYLDKRATAFRRYPRTKSIYHLISLLSASPVRRCFPLFLFYS